MHRLPGCPALPWLLVHDQLLLLLLILWLQPLLWQQQAAAGYVPVH
jgi:hypothetical protein